MHRNSPHEEREKGIKHKGNSLDKGWGGVKMCENKGWVVRSSGILKYINGNNWECEWNIFLRRTFKM